ncbi:nuclease-related domain-containing protein [Cryobacterium sp. W22_MBD10_FK3]|uniref:nuclease-related domain-containing protein n=1 Tax=Cryobacterium sp. W22_MBD10_FK3 TaxID=3240273 RepID=UPI003F91A643
MSDEAAPPPTGMRLRYAARCRACGSAIPAGTVAVYERESKTVTCVECPAHSTQAAPVAASPVVIPSPETLNVVELEQETEHLEVLRGTAGASARREHERLREKRATGIRDKHPHLGNLILALSDDPQSTQAWAIGARGEEVLGQRLDTLSERGVHVLHDRRIPSSKANIDHIAVTAAGVFVVDAKKYQGRPSLRVEGGLFSPRTEKLMVGSRDRTKQVAGVQKQVSLVKSALRDAGMEEIPVHGMLCFIGADWPLIGGAFVIDGVHVVWPKKAVDILLKPGPLTEQTARLVHGLLAASFLPA